MTLSFVYTLIAVAGLLAGCELPGQAVKLVQVKSIASSSPLTVSPEGPQGFGIAAGDGQIRLSWSANPRAISYSVRRSTQMGAEEELKAGLTSTSFVDLNVQNGVTYYYVIVMAGKSGRGSASAEVSATPQKSAIALLAPENLQAHAGLAEVNLSWAAVSGAVTYTLRRGINAGAEVDYKAGLIQTNFKDSSVLNGTLYYYTVVSVSSGNLSRPSLESSAAPLAQTVTLDPPQKLLADAGRSQVGLHWNPVSGATSYTLRRGLVSGLETDYRNGLLEPTFQDTSVDAGQSYYYVVLAANSLGSSGDSNEVKSTPQVPLLDAPQKVQSTVYNGGLKLTWDPVVGATTYRVMRSASAGQEKYWQETKSNNFEDPSFEYGALYYYQVVAVKEGGVLGDFSQEFRVIASYPPYFLKALGRTSDVFISWERSPGAISYTLRRGTSAGLEKDFQTGLKEPYFADSNVQNGTAYFYTITAVCPGGTLPNLQEVSAIPQAPAIPGAPQNLQAHSFITGEVDLTWDRSSTNGSTYIVKRSTLPGQEQVIKTGLTSLGYTDTSVQNGTAYYYKVTTLNAGGASLASNEAIATPRIAAPQGLYSSQGGGRINLMWLPTPGATSYVVRRATSAAQEEDYATVQASSEVQMSFTDSSLVYDKLYYYTVIALDAHSVSVASLEVYANSRGTDPSPPQNLQAKSAIGQVELTWNSTPQSTFYNINRGLLAGHEQFLAQVGPGATSYSDNSAVSGTTYFYTLVVVTSGGGSPSSSEVDAQSLAPPPLQNLQAQGLVGQVGLTWSSIPQAVVYNISRAVSSGREQYLAQVGPSATNYLDKSVVSGTNYFYTVTIVTFGGVSLPSNEVSARPAEGPPPIPNPPQNLQGQGLAGLVGLTWSSVPQATVYNINRGTIAGREQYLDQVGPGATSYTDHSVIGGTSYFYTLSAVTPGGISLPSSEVSVASVAPSATTPPAPKNFQARGLTERVDLSWSPVPQAVEYRIHRGTSAGQEKDYAQVSSSATNYQDSSTASGTTYYYNVSVVTSGGSSPLSSEMSATPQLATPSTPSAPQNFQAQGFTEQVDLTWSPVPQAVVYNINRGTSSGQEHYLVQVGPDVTSYSDVSAGYGTTYYYTITVVTPGGLSLPANEARATPAASTPLPPQNLQAEAQIGLIILTWAPVNRSITYLIYRGTGAGQEYYYRTVAPNSTSYSTSYRDSDVGAARYFYTVISNGPGGVSLPSGEVSARPKSRFPGP